MYLKPAFLAVALLGTITQSLAEPISDSTKCAVVADAFDAPSPDLRKVREIADYIQGIMQGIDKGYGMRNKIEILPRMERKSVGSLIAMVTVRCRDRQEVSIRAVAIETYTGMRAMQKGFGMAD